MGYVPGLPEDDASHDAYCDLISNGPTLTDIASAEWLSEIGEDRILVVTDDSPPAHKKLAHDLAICANREMRYDMGIYRVYDPPDERRIHLFLYARKARVVGLLVFERRTTIWRCTWRPNNNPECIERPDRAGMWSVGFVWVHERQRRTYVAANLFIAALKYLSLAEDDIGWYAPFSRDGEAFVRSKCPINFYVAK